MKAWILGIVAVLAMGATGCYDYSVAETYCANEDGSCTVCAGGDCSTNVAITNPPAPVKDTCDSVSFRANMLLGSCWTEQCVKGERMLIPKIAGVNCVFVPKNATNDEFVIGSCNDSGVCGQ